jgi:hypothetical protein
MLLISAVATCDVISGLSQLSVRSRDNFFFLLENHYRTPEEVGLISVDVSVINLGNEKCMQNFRREILKRYGGKRANKPTTFMRLLS